MSWSGPCNSSYNSYQFITFMTIDVVPSYKNMSLLCQSLILYIFDLVMQKIEQCNQHHPTQSTVLDCYIYKQTKEYCLETTQTASKLKCVRIRHSHLSHIDQFSISFDHDLTSIIPNPPLLYFYLFSINSMNLSPLFPLSYVER